MKKKIEPSHILILTLDIDIIEKKLRKWNIFGSILIPSFLLDTETSCLSVQATGVFNINSSAWTKLLFMFVFLFKPQSNMLLYSAAIISTPVYNILPYP